MAVLNSSIEKKLWDAADSLRTNSKLKSSEYATPVLELVFLRFADYRFSQASLVIEKEFENSRREPSAIDYQRLPGVMYVPPKAKYSYLLNLPEGEDIQQSVIQAMKDIEEANPELKDVLYKHYTRVPKDLLLSLLKIIQSQAVDVMISISSNFFYTVMLSCTLWFFDNDKEHHTRKDTVLFIK